MNALKVLFALLLRCSLVPRRQRIVEEQRVRMYMKAPKVIFALLLLRDSIPAAGRPSVPGRMLGMLYGGAGLRIQY